MSCLLYMDVHIPKVVTNALRQRGVDVLTAQEDGNRRLADPLLLSRATILGRALVTHDDDFLVEAALRQRTGIAFAGVIFLRELATTIGSAIADLEIIALASAPDELLNAVIYLPFR